MADKDISKTLVVGLGGTGQTMIRDIKKRLLRTYGEIPSLVRFLEFDTDEIDNNENTPFKYYYDGKTYEDFKYRIENNEFFKIHSPGMDAVRRDPICSEKLDLNQMAKVSSRCPGNGAGGYRVLGRAHFLNKSGEIINVLTTAIANLRAAGLTAQEQARNYVVKGTSISVYVIASLAGGTGSSAFMDMSRMLQIAGINVQYATTAQQDKIFGVFFLPKFFEGKPMTDNIHVNAYTALSELDYTFDLADPTRHEVGTQEIQDDRQDYQGHVDHGKRVIYDGIYLIDSLTSKGQTHTLKEASNYVASFIAGSIAADAGALLSNYVNSNHKMTEIDGKYQNYSSLGYCELRFNRQELVRYLLNKKLIGSLEHFKMGDGTTTVSQTVTSFLKDNKLNEGTMRNSEGEDNRAQLNELTDSIIDMNSRNLISINMSPVNVGNEAAETIVTSKTRYLTAIGTAAQEMVNAFARQKEDLFQSLKTLLEQHMTGKGFVTFPDLAIRLKSEFGAMKKGLEDELASHEQMFEKIETDLKKVKTTIAENSSGGFIGIGNKHPQQQAAIRSYSNKVRFDAGNVTEPTLAWLKVETARKNEAVAIYDEMIRIVENYYKEESVETVNGSMKNVTGLYTAIDRLYKGLMDLLVTENNGYLPSKAAINETVFADAYFKEYFENHDETMALIDQNQIELEDYIASLFVDLPAANQQKLVEMREKLLGLLPADGLVRRIQEEKMSIDDLFIHCFGKYGDIVNKQDMIANPQLKMLNQVDTLFETLWCYLNFSGQGLAPTKNLVVGVYDTQNNIFNTINGYQATISGWNAYQYISLGDPDKIAFMLMETAIPGFKLVEMDAWANEFRQKKEKTYTFSDVRLENIDMIKPGVNEDAEVAWAYGWLFGLITKSRRRGVRVIPSYSYTSRKNITPENSSGECNIFKGETDLYVCHQKFINDLELSKDIHDYAMSLLSKNLVDSIIKLKEWVNKDGNKDGKMWSSEVRGSERNSLSPREQKIITNEVKYLALRFPRFSGFDLKLDNEGQVTHPYSEAVAKREEELKD